MKIKIPKGYKNIGITMDNKLIADTNNSKHWDTLSIPLPKKLFRTWKIVSIDSETGLIVLN